MGRGLAQIQTGVEENPLGPDARVLRPPGPLQEERLDLAHHVVVGGVGVGDSRPEPDVGGDDRGAGGRGHRQVVGVGEP